MRPAGTFGRVDYFTTPDRPGPSRAGSVAVAKSGRPGSCRWNLLEFAGFLSRCQWQS